MTTSARIRGIALATPAAEAVGNNLGDGDSHEHQSEDRVADAGA